MNSHILLLPGILPLIPIGSFAYAWSHDCFRGRQTLRSCGSCIGSPEKNCFCFLNVCSSVGRLNTLTIPPKGTVYILSPPNFLNSNLSHIVLEENKTIHSGLCELGLDLLSRDKTVAWGKSNMRRGIKYRQLFSHLNKNNVFVGEKMLKKKLFRSLSAKASE